MPRYEVRTNCEYIIEVDARSADEAMEKAQEIDVAKWGQQAWAPIEAEEIAEDFGAKRVRVKEVI